MPTSRSLASLGMTNESLFPPRPPRPPRPPPVRSDSQHQDSSVRTIIETDICIIGSGISAAMVAERLARGGGPSRDIVVLEAGDEVPPLANRYALRERTPAHEALSDARAPAHVQLDAPQGLGREGWYLDVESALREEFRPVWRPRSVLSQRHLRADLSDRREVLARFHVEYASRREEGAARDAHARQAPRARARVVTR